MIWKRERFTRQGRLVADLYDQAAGVPCERRAVMAGGRPGADKARVLGHEGITGLDYLTVSVAAVLEEMAARGLIPVAGGLSPMEAADMAHTEAQFIAKRIAMRALADGRNVILDVSMASHLSVTSWIAALRSAGYAVNGVFVDLPVDEAVRRCEAAHRRGEDDYRRGVGNGGRYIPAAAIRALADHPRSRPNGRAGRMSPAVTRASGGAGFGAGPVTDLIPGTGPAR